MDFARDLIITSAARNQGEPAFEPAVVLLQIDTQTDVTEESFVVVAVIDRDINLGVVTKDITVNGLAIKHLAQTGDIQHRLVVPMRIGHGASALVVTF